MSVNSVSSVSSYASQIQAQPQMPSEDIAEKKSVNDVGATAAVSAALKPTMNTSGQMTGSIINIQA